MKRFRRAAEPPGQRTIDDLLTEPDPNIVIRCRVCRRPLRTAPTRRAGIGKRCQQREKGRP